MDDAKIFISYRRDDSIAATESIYNKLVLNFGEEQVFMDVEKIAPGENFERLLEKTVAECTVMLAIVGPKWLSMTNSAGQRRLDLPKDFVRQEIAAGLRRGIRLIPVVLEGAQMPRKEDLPADLVEFASLNAMEISDRRVKQDVDTLIREIEGKPQRAWVERAERLRRRWAWTIVPSTALLMFFAAWTGLFDTLDLDTKIESLTIAAGSSFRRAAVGDRLAIVVIDKASEADFAAKRANGTARGELAKLIEALSRSGAKTVAFDMFLSAPSASDVELIAAIRSAAGRGTAVVFGTQDGKSSISGLREATGALALLCAGKRLGRATVVPLATAPKPGAANEPLVALAVLAAHPGAIVEHVDSASKYLLIRAPAGVDQVGFSLQQEISRTQPQCPALRKGDVVEQLIIEFRPLESLRDPARRYRYQDVVATAAQSPQRFAGKIVLVGQEIDKDTVILGFGSEERYGFEVHADTLNTLLQGTRIHALDPLGQFFILLCMGALGAAAPVAKPLASRLRRRIYVAVVLGVYLFAALAAYVAADALLNTAYHLGAFAVAYWALAGVSRRLKLSTQPEGEARRARFLG